MQVQVLSRAPTDTDRDMRNKDKTLPATDRVIPHYLSVIAILTSGFLAYYTSITKGAFLFDDKALILDNFLIKDFSHIREIFTTHLFFGSGVYSNFYRPLQSLSFMVDYHLWGLNPAGYHLTNVVIHLLNAVGVYFLVYLVSGRRKAGLIAGLLFSVHTVLAGIVNYVSARDNLLGTFFLLITMTLYALYIRGPVKKYKPLLFTGSFLAFIFALLSREVSLIMPLLLLLYLYCFNGKDKDNRVSSLIWLFFAVVCIYAYIRLTLLNFAGGKILETTLARIPVHLRLLTTRKVLMIYLRLLIFPVGLHMEWNIEPARSLAQDEIFLSMVGVCLIAGYFYFLSRISKLKFFMLGWFLIMLIPYSNIVPLAYFMGEGWLYLPSIGFFGLVAVYLSELVERSRLWTCVVASVLIPVLVCYGFLTSRRADVWSDPMKLYAEILRHSPDSSKARINLGVELAESGQREKAIDAYKEAAELSPSDSGVRGNLEVMYADSDKYDVALEEFRKAVELNPQDYVAHMNIGIIYKKRGDYENALREYKRCVEINPNYPLVYNNIGNVYLEQGRYDDAIDFYLKAIAIDPNKAAFYGNLGKAYKNKGMIREAREAFRRALALDSNNQDAAKELNSLD